MSRAFLILVGAALVVSFVGIGNHELWTPDEPRVAAIGREMWQSGSWAVPRLSGEAFLEKPPFYWWTQAAVFEVFGRATAGLARLPSAFFGFATVLMTWSLGRRFFSPAASLFGGLVLLTTFRFVRQAHWAIVDTALLAATTGALLCYLLALERRRTALLAGLYASLAVAFLTKGVVGVGIPVLAMAVHLVWTRRLREFAGLHLVAGAGAIAAVVALWLWRLWAAEGSAGLQEFLVYNQLGRFFPGVAYAGGHERPIYYYLRQLPMDMLPWTPPLLLAAIHARRYWPRLDEPARAGIRFVVASSVPVVAVLSLAGTKRGLYLLPILPPLALLVGWWMASGLEGAGWERRLDRIWRRVLVATAALLSVSAVFFNASFWAWSLAGAATFAAAAWLVGRLRLERWPAVVTLVAVAWTLALATAVPANDPNKNLRPLLEEVDRRVPRDATLYAFQPSETTRGFISFYTGRTPWIVQELEVMRALAANGSPAWTLVEAKASGGDYAELAEAGIPHRIVASHTTRSGRMLHLLSVGRP